MIPLTEVNTELTAGEILEKDFKKGMRGYNEAEVDEFLDMIIKDYEAFTQEIKRLKQENDRYKKNMEQSTTRASQNSHQVNYDVLKRLSNLEKEVFGQKRSDS